MIKIPWTIKDVDRHIKGLSNVQKEGWIEIANKTLSDCLAKGGKQEFCEGKAIRIANAMAKRVKESRGKDMKNLKSIDILEHSNLKGATYDSEKRMAEVTIIEGGESKNDRIYTDKALDDLIGLVEGSKAYYDHPTITERKERPERSIRDLAGSYSNVRRVGNAVVADLKVLKKAEDVWTVLEEASELLGISINAKGKVYQKDGKDVVESIISVRSVDLVTEPAAGGRINQLLASKRKENDMEWKDITLEELKENRADIVEDIEKEVKKAIQAPVDEKVKKLEETLKEKDKTIKNSDKKIADFEAAEALRVKKALVEKKLVKSNLPEVAIADLRETLVNIEKEEDINKAIEDRKEMIKKVGNESVITEMGSAGDEEGKGGITDKEIIAAVKGK